MRLKSIVIKGFKSFADETVIHFNEAVTGIVGPNGSGKSNIVDAIRWVLGEQKGRELRLEQMSDVIFNGTKKRKEAPMAKVSLNFDNTKNILRTDFQSVQIERLLYRSGDSEFRLNGLPCRLKDITSLFLDTGIGPDSYAIIALGMVEEILANKDNARRRMFEQAAGISKYKTRKKETLNKLRASREDLARIEDLLFEINNHLAELEKQAKRTMKFNELKEKYKNAGLLLQYNIAKALNEQLINFDAQIDRELTKLRDQEVDLHLAQAELEQLKKYNLDQEKGLTDFQKKVNELIGQLKDIESAIQIKTQSKVLHQNQIESLNESISSSEGKLQLLNHAVTQLAKEKSQCEQTLNQSVLALQNHEMVYLQMQDKYQQLKYNVDTTQLERHKQEKNIYTIEKEIAISLNNIENLKNDSARCREDLEARSHEHKAVEEQIRTSQWELKNLRDEISYLMESEEERKGKLKGLQEEIEKLTKEVAGNNRLRDAKRNEYDLLQSMVEKMEGFPESMRFLRQNWRSDVPVLSDLIYCDEKYRASIELYLEPYLNYYVVRNEQEAVQAVRLLFNNAKGKANFFVLDKFKDVPRQHRNLPGCRAVVDIVETESLYESLLHNLLHNVYVLEVDEHLEDVMRFPDEITIVSMSGSIIKNQNTIAGGSVGLFEGKKIGRKKNLDKLKLEIANIEKHGIELERQLAMFRNELKRYEFNTKDPEIGELKEREIVLVQQLAQADSRFTYLSDLQNQLKNRIKGLEEEHKEQVSFLESRRNQLQLLQSEINQLLEQISQSDKVFDAVTNDLSAAANAYNQAKLELLRWQNKLSNFQKDLDYKNQQIQEIETHKRMDQEKLEHLKTVVEQTSVEIEQLQNRQLELIELRKTFESNLSELEREYYENRNALTAKEEKIKQGQGLLSELQSAINAIKDQRNECRFRLQSCYDKAKIEFNYDLHDYVPDGEMAEWEAERIAERAQYYKARLDNYGEINPLALEAYEEMHKRFDKIQAQKNDVITAQDSLLQTIKEIEETASKAFLNAFNQVRVHFKSVFRNLFTEDDDCDLILVDENDPLECDIDIVAKPKGKRPKSIAQLSGGEKTLTAIAVLFSLYLLKPAPFCVFDEVDAPLDDVNIEKFNNIIRKFSKESQFIIITHNKLTMADVDVLYGVYMEEQGVSSVTAVDFRQFKHELQLEELAG